MRGVHREGAPVDLLPARVLITLHLSAVVLEAGLIPLSIVVADVHNESFQLRTYWLLLDSRPAERALCRDGKLLGRDPPRGCRPPVFIRIKEET